MTNPPSFGGNDFLRQMLGDIMRMMPKPGSGIPWQFSYQMASDIASGGGPDPNPDPLERIGLEQLSSIAEMHVSEISGMPSSPSGSGVRLVPTSRGEWARRTLDSWRPVLDRLTAGTGGSGAAVEPSSGDDAEDEGEAPNEQQLLALLGQWATAISPTMTAAQVGSIAGHLAEKALGPYDVPLVPAPSSELLVISKNVAQIAQDWSLPIDDLRLWLAIHEISYHVVLSRPVVSDRLADLVVEHAANARPDANRMEELLKGADLSDPAALGRLFGDEGAFGNLEIESTPEQERVRAELDALCAAIAGYAEHVTSVAASRVIGDQVPIGEAMRRRRIGRSEGEKVAEHLFGLSLDQALIDRGERFVTGVLERSGEAELATMWVEAANFPTPAEVDAPGLWLARLNLPEG